MAMGEFDLIKRYFQQQILVDDSVQLSIGDDCAMVSVPGRIISLPLRRIQW